MDGSDYISTSTQGDNAFGWDTAGDLEDMVLDLLAGGGTTVQTKLDMILNVIDGKAANTALYAGSGNVTGLERVNQMRADIGALTNRMDHTVNNLMNQATNTQAAESVIRDSDFASETAHYTKNNILIQSATAMLAQANMVPQGVLRLLS
jgi:flagellin